MKEHGNPDQWKDNYPPLELTTQDIRSGCLHVCIIRANDRERIGGVFYFHPEEDPDYLNIDGSWLNSCLMPLFTELPQHRTRKALPPSA